MNNRILMGLAKQAKSFVDERGGTDALGSEAKKLQDIVKGKGSISDKAKEAAASAKEFATAKPGEAPGAAPGTGTPAATTAQPTAPAGGAPAAAPGTPTPPATPSEPPAFED